jgi:hypothetical protein
MKGCNISGRNEERKEATIHTKGIITLDRTVNEREEARIGKSVSGEVAATRSREGMQSDGNEGG